MTTNAQRKHLGIWPDIARTAWIKWSGWQEPSSAPSTNLVRPPMAERSIRSYEEQISKAFEWAIDSKRDPLDVVKDNETIEALFWSMKDSGYAVDTLRLRMIALKRLAEVLDPNSDPAMFRRLYKPLPRKSSRKPRIRKSNELLEIGMDIMMLAKTKKKVDLAAAVEYRRGLMIALLACRPRRLKTFCELEWSPTGIAIDRTKPRIELVDSTYTIVCPPKIYRRPTSGGASGGGSPLSTNFRGGKNEVEEQEVPKFLVNWLESYLATYRPILLGGETQCRALWISLEGKRLSKLQFWKDCREFTGCSPRDFRSSYVTTISASDEEDESGMHRLLGHTPEVMYDRYVVRDSSASIKIANDVNAILDEILDGTDDDGSKPTDGEEDAA